MKSDGKSRYSILLCTTPTKEAALALAELLVPGRLAACVNIVEGITSVYRWKGKICRDTECLMIIKSRKNLFEKITQTIKENHPYEVPEIISFPITQGHVPYLKWIDENTDESL